MLFAGNSNTCPDGSDPVNCLVDPCQSATCPGVDNATCVADYCGGCNAKWFVDGVEVTDQCQSERDHYIICSETQLYTSVHSMWLQKKWLLHTIFPIVECPIEGQVFMECGTACPPTCEPPSPICTLQCVPECQCAGGLVLDGDRCIPREECGEEL